MPTDAMIPGVCMCRGLEEEEEEFGPGVVFDLTEQLGRIRTAGLIVKWISALNQNLLIILRVQRFRSYRPAFFPLSRNGNFIECLYT